MNFLGDRRSEQSKGSAEGGEIGRSLGVEVREASIDQVAAQLSFQFAEAQALQMLERARTQQARLVEISRDYRIDNLAPTCRGSRAVFATANGDWRLEIELPLAGRFQVQNALAAAAAARLLSERGFRMDDAAIAQADAEGVVGELHVEHTLICR